VRRESRGKHRGEAEQPPSSDGAVDESGENTD